MSSNGKQEVLVCPRQGVSHNSWSQDVLISKTARPVGRPVLLSRETNSTVTNMTNCMQSSKLPVISNIPQNSQGSGTESTTVNTANQLIEQHKDTPPTEAGDATVSPPTDAAPQEEAVKRVRLVKLYAWLKEELSRSTAKMVAGHLYQRKLLPFLLYESICQTPWRRATVEQLLKNILMGPDGIHDVFIEALIKQEEGHIADRLTRTVPSTQDLDLFSRLEQSSLEQCCRPDNHEPRLSFSHSDHQTLIYYLNNKNIIDSMNDHFLSRFIFSIREHTNIVISAPDEERRVKQLVETMKLCASKIFDDFCDICTQIEMEHLIRKLEKRVQEKVMLKPQRQKRKSTPTQENDASSEPSSSTSSTLAKRQCLSSSDEHSLVSSMQRSSSTLRLHAMDQLGFDVENVNNGSIILQLCPRMPDSWRRLEENCRTGKIKDFIPVVYNNEAGKDLLQEGEYRLKFTIYTLPTPANNAPDEKKVMFHLETEAENTKENVPVKDSASSTQPDNLIEEYMELFCEELEISKDLLTKLKKEKLVEDNIKSEIDKQGSRSKKIKFLLTKLSSQGEKGYRVLKEFIKDDNEDLHRELETREKVKVIDSKMDTAAKVTRKPSNGGHRSVFKKEVFFTGTVVLLVQKKGESGSKENQCPGSATTELEIVCPEILNPVCHFSTKDQGKLPSSGEVTMVLEEAWSLGGGAKPAKQREILVGKRKQAKSSGKEVLKRRAHSEETESEDESQTPSSSVDYGRLLDGL